MVRQHLVVGFDQDRVAAANGERRRRLDRGRGIDRFVLERGDVVGQRHVDGLDIGIFQPDGLQQGVERRRVADPGRVHGELHALEILERLVASAVDMILAHQNLGAAVAGRGRRLVRHDLDPDAARDRVVEPGRGGAGTGFELAGAERRHHVRRRAEVDHLDVQAFLAEVALLVCDEDRRIARAAGRADRDGPARPPLRRRRQGCAYENCEQGPIVQARSSGSFLVLAQYRSSDA